MSPTMRLLLAALLILLLAPSIASAKRLHYQATFTPRTVHVTHLQRPTVRLQDAFTVATAATTELGTPTYWMLAGSPSDLDRPLVRFRSCTPHLERDWDLGEQDGYVVLARADMGACNVRIRSDARNYLTTAAGRRRVCTALAHELGHLILGPQHTDTGLMRPVMDENDRSIVPPGCWQWAS